MCPMVAAKYATDEDIVARTILRESCENGQLAYDAMAWLIYNRMLAARKEFGGECPKDICLKREAFTAWKTFWGMKNVPPNPHSTSHDDYDYCLKLAKNITAKRKPNNQNDPTQKALYYVSDSLTGRKKYKSAVLIGGNLYLKTF
jgi:hypothetical protein